MGWREVEKREDIVANDGRRSLDEGKKLGWRKNVVGMEEGRLGDGGMAGDNDMTAVAQ